MSFYLQISYCRDTNHFLQIPYCRDMNLHHPLYPQQTSLTALPQCYVTLYIPNKPVSLPYLNATSPSISPTNQSHCFTSMLRHPLYPQQTSLTALPQCYVTLYIPNQYSFTATPQVYHISSVPQLKASVKAMFTRVKTNRTKNCFIN